MIVQVKCAHCPNVYAGDTDRVMTSSFVANSKGAPSGPTDYHFTCPSCGKRTTITIQDPRP